MLLTPYYSEYQWATCLTDDYITRSSDQAHHCLFSATICWYQCQVESHSLGTGPVYDDCRCSQDVTISSTTNDMPTLAPRCFSPSGDDCGWYRECLEARYPCEGTEHGYAVEYAEKFCNLYTDRFDKFSLSGRLWVDSVRKCLQVALVPALRPWVRETCADLRRVALDSHSDCYIDPASGAPSICELSCEDVWSVFWTVNGIPGSRAITTAPIETGKQMLEVVYGCIRIRGCISSTTMTAVLISLPGFGVLLAGSRLTAATIITTFIAISLKFDEKGIGWFPFVDSNSDSNNDMSLRKRRNVLSTPHSTSDDDIVLLLVSLASLNISSNSSSPQGVHNIVNALVDAVNNGLLSQIPVMVNDTEMTLGVSSLGQCEDILCSNHTNVTNLAIASGAEILRPFCVYMIILWNLMLVWVYTVFE